MGAGRPPSLISPGRSARWETGGGSAPSHLTTPTVILRDLDATAAHGHRTPRPAPVPRVVVEGPPACVPSAGLESPEATLEHLHDDDRGEPAERRIQTSPDRL